MKQRILSLSLIATLLAILSACSDPAPRGGGDILAMGDSVMAWNGASGNAIPDALGSALGRDVVSKAVPGAQFDNSSRLAGAVGFEIQRQFPGGQWNWIVLNGGANDLNSDCGCGACGPTVDQLIGAGGMNGSIPAYLERLRGQSGARILWMGYYAGNGRGSFEGCRDYLVRIEERIARFADARDWMFFVDSEDAIDRNDPTLFASDNTHPSAKASALIGVQLAQAITQAGRSQNP